MRKKRVASGVPARPLDPRRGRGSAAEDRAASELERRGLHIVERNFRCRAGELDIIATEDNVLVFVEVRSRFGSKSGTAVEAVGASKRAQVTRVAEIYLAVRRITAPRCRFDIVGITDGKLEYIRDAWRPGLP